MKFEAAGRSEGRDRVRLKGNGETESFKRMELANSRQITTTTDFFPYLFPPKNITNNITTIIPVSGTLR